MKHGIILFLASLLSSSALNAAEKVDLTTITHFAPKGRVQDKSYNPNEPVIDSLVAKGTGSIPLLIELLDNDTIIDHQVLDWPQNSVGDIAFVILTDFAQGSNGKATILWGIMGRVSRIETGYERSGVEPVGRL